MGLGEPWCPLGRSSSKTLTKGKFFCNIYKYRIPTKGTIFCVFHKYINPTKGNIFCDIYKSIAKNPTKNVKLEELTLRKSMY